MSRLRRPFLSDRYIFVTVKVLKPRRHLGEGDFKRLASAMSRMRQNVEYIPMNPVRRGLVKREEEWKGSSVRE